MIFVLSAILFLILFTVGLATWIVIATQFWWAVLIAIILYVFAGVSTVLSLRWLIFGRG